MLDGVPFGSAGRVVGHGDIEFEAIAKLRLELSLPSPAPIAVAAATVGQDKESACAAVANSPFALPPSSDAMSGKSRGVV